MEVIKNRMTITKCLQKKTKKNSDHLSGNSSSKATTVSEDVFDKIADVNLEKRRYVLKGRVIVKTPMKILTTGRVFSFDLTDDSGIVRCVAYHDSAAKIFNQIELFQVYRISAKIVRPKNAMYNKLDHEFEIVLTSDSSVSLMEDDDETIPKLQLQYQTIKEICELKIGNCLDLLVAVSEVKPREPIFSPKQEKMLQKQEIIVIDESKFQVQLTIWNERITELSIAEGDILSLYQVQIKDFKNIKQLSLSQNSGISKNPNIAETSKLKKWYQELGTGIPFDDVNSNDS